MITLIGTGHVFDLSSAISKILDGKLPDVICVELDEQRYNALMIKLADPDKYKSAERALPFVYKILARFQDSMAQEYGVTAGDEMLTAIKYAKNHQITVEFIDMNAQHLFTRMLKNMPFFEKIKLILMSIGGIFVSKKRVEKELRKFENDFDSYIEEIGKKFPTIKRVLIDERNKYMVQRLVELDKQYEKVVAVIGDGHIPGISELLNSKEIDFEIIRLRELRNQDVIPSDTSKASFTVKYKEQ